MKKTVLALKNDFDQPLVGRAPIRWSKYTTANHLLIVLDCYLRKAIIEFTLPLQLKEKYYFGQLIKSS